MFLGFIFTIVIILIGCSLINGNDKEANNQAVGGIIIFFVVGLFITFIFNAIFNGCT